MTENRMRHATVVILALSFLLVFGCKGQTGGDGDSYIAYTWLYGPFIFLTDDPAIPTIIFNGKYYTATPGTYAYAYEAWDGSLWSGTYRIYLDEGESGDWFWRDGEDGKDKCFQLTCLAVGPSFRASDCAFTGTTLRMQEEMERVARFGIETQHKTSSSKSREDLKSYFGMLDTSDSTVVSQTGKQGNVYYEHRFKQIR